jgi:PAS domain S-box-containing protein
MGDLPKINAPNEAPTDAPLAGDLERRVAEILDGLGEGFVAFDFNWQVVYCNRAGEAHFGLPRQEILGRVIWDLIPSRPDGELRRFLSEAMLSRRSVDAEVPSDIFPGRWIAFRAFPLDQGLGINFHDVTERRERAARLAELERRRAFLLELTDALRPLAEPDEILTAAARLLAERLGAARAGYAEISDDGAAMIIRGEWSTLGAPKLAGSAFPLCAFGGLGPALETGETFVVPDVRSDPRTGQASAAFLQIRAGALLIVPLVRAGRLEAFVFASAREPRAWSGEDQALAEEVAGRTWSALVRARSELALRESEARFRAMADSAPAPVWVTGAAGPVEFVNRAFCDLVGKTFDELMGDTWVGLMHPEDVPAVAQARTEARRDLRPYGFEARFRDADGAWRWMRASCQPRFDAQGVFQGYVGLSMDVTETRRAEERQHLLINELNHRVKNTLATIQSLARQTLREGMVTREARERFNDRLLALSAAHNVLTRRNWEGAELSEIASEAVQPYDEPQAPRIALLGPSARLAPNVALAVSMALHELATNAVKYGALSVADGRVTVDWTMTDAAIELVWREAGGPPVAPPSANGKGFGSRLLNQGLAAELGAPAEVEYRAEGLVCRLRAPTAN